MKVFDSGAKSSEPKPRYDLLPLEGVQRGARRMAEGAASHGERNYERGVADADFVKDRENHLIEHAILYAAGDRSTDHLGAIIANACMLARLEALSEASANDQTLTDLIEQAKAFAQRSTVVTGPRLGALWCGSADATGEP